ncbi:MAG: flagellar hook-length control protein FliK [Anaerolineaceae bacterium]|nr:MAG: flagellar hook-length control protein FliK [Anaerolineaceae bacterium]
MRAINTDKGVDILLEILRQSQAIKTNIQNKEETKVPDTKEADNEPSYKSRASLRRTDTDKKYRITGKRHHINQQKKDDTYYKTKNLIESVLNRMTAQDYKMLSEEGFKPEDLTIESLTVAVQLIKNYGDRNKIGGKEYKADKKKESVIGLEKISEDDIKKRMEDENLPINNDSIERIIRAMKLSEDIPHMNKKDILYLFNKELTPSIENLYKARYSKQSNEAIEKLSDAEWKELIPQVREIIGKTESIDDKEVLEDAKWLIENNIPLTKDNINLLIGLEDLAQNYSKDIIFDRILKGMKEGLLPGDAILIEKETQAKELTAKRQMEEIRLKMTLEAAMGLEKKGFHIETEALERVVERLRSEEEIYYQELYNQAIEESEESMLRLLQLTSESMDELKKVPVHVLGMTLSDRGNQTIPSLLATGRSIIIELDKAKEAYEALFTMPKAEYGDSIKKAFSNISSLMEEMGIENTEYNQRAIRILGYNRMEITKESIEQVKAYDLSVNNLIQNLNPGVTVQIIKEGVNPLDTPIDELNSRIEKLKEQGYSSLDKYSSYLYKLEKEEGILETERKAYIGIYRLLYQIEKSDGAALGALIKSDQEVTLNHLLTALRTNRKGSMEYKIDDEFGALEEVSFEKESISDQLKAVFNDSSQEDIIKGTAAYSNEPSVQDEVQNAIVKELLNSLTPHRLHQLHISIQNTALKSEGGLAALPNVWDTIGNMSTEQLLEQIKNIETNPGEEQAYYYEKLRELQEIYSNCDKSIRFLNGFKLPCTTTNLMMTGQILNNSTAVFKKLFGLIQDKEDEKDEKSQKRLKKKLDLSDTLIDNETMTEAYEELEQEVKALIEEEAVKDNIDLGNLTDLKSMGMQMHFLKNLAMREFYQIPIETSGRITNINLTIIRDKSAGGKVTVALMSEKLGSIKAEASLKGDKLSGYIVCDHIESLKIIETQTEDLNSLAQEENISIKQLSFCLQQASDTRYSPQNSLDVDEDKNPETERILYRVAKAMIQMIRSAEETESAVA